MTPALPRPRRQDLTSARLSRRSLLAGAGVGAAALLLGDCGIPGSASQAAENTDWTTYWSNQRPTKSLNFANWPLYIDSEHGRSESLALFTQATGISVNYEPVIQGDESFYAAVEPELVARQPTGYDLAVVTNGWYLTQLINGNFLIELDHARLPNFAKYASPYVMSPNYDPGNRFTVTWQTGFTGIAYNTQKISRPITSFNDLADPAFAGAVGMMNDLDDLGSAALLRNGVLPGNSTPDDWAKAAEWLDRQRPLVAGYYDQSYIQHLENGDTWISQAWSGDIFQANLSGYPHLKFVVPEEGQIVWHDNLVILRGASNPLSAIDWMNFYYTPKIAGIVEDWVNYVCPVPQAQAYILDVLDDPVVANSPLVFPTTKVNEASHTYYVFRDVNEYETWVNTFSPIIES